MVFVLFPLSYANNQNNFQFYSLKSQVSCLHVHRCSRLQDGICQMTVALYVTLKAAVIPFKNNDSLLAVLQCFFCCFGDGKILVSPHAVVKETIACVTFLLLDCGSMRSRKRRNSSKAVKSNTWFLESQKFSM